MTGRPTALVTGASSGIGAATARLLAAQGYDLILVARREDKLAAEAESLRQAGSRVEILPADLADHQGLRTVADRVQDGPVDLLVSNAGTSAYTPLADLTPDDVDHLWRLNATAHITLTRAVLPAMLHTGSGGIITVASLLAFSAGLDMGFPRTLYVAAKSAVVGFTRSLAGELRGTGVSATVVCPGLVDTEWSGGANHGDPRAMPAPDVAQSLLTAHRQGEVLCVPGIEDRDVIRRWTDTEPTLLLQGNHAELAPRYRRPAP
ncbi:SDR family NAD(P)-dependent oxidoreductase [Streptomyces sp. NPDC001093]|uniref:SDR family NAD(P)-dependent oxidoreductase n=1 Tax=Streptomyces sp. NPDC001093 TaxID=3154376 RepID=UPI00331CBF02